MVNVDIRDNIESTSKTSIAVDIYSDTIKTTLPSSTKVQVNDSYTLQPTKVNIGTTFNLPTSVINEQNLNIANIESALLTEIGDREAAIISSNTYADTVADAVRTQTLATVSDNYLSNTDANAYIKSTDIATMSIEYDVGNGLTTASFAQLNDKTIEVGNNYAGLATELQVIVDDYTASASTLTTLKAATDGYEARIESAEGVIAGKLPLTITVGGPAPVDPVIGHVWDNGTDVKQYIGGALGINNDGWALTDIPAGSLTADVDGNTTDVPIEGWAAGASKLSVTDGAITGWSFADGSVGGSKFVINADEFQLKDSTGSADVPFSVVAGTPNKISFNGVVDFSNSNTTAFENSQISINSDGSLNNAGSGSVTPTGIGAETPAGAQSKASTAESNAVTAAALDATAKSSTAEENARDKLAVELGYTSYADMQAKVVTYGKVTVDGGKLNANLIEAGVVVAGSVDAENINAGTISGMSITASTFTGDTFRLNSTTYPAYPFFKSAIKRCYSTIDYYLGSFGFAPAEHSGSSTPFRIKDTTSFLESPGSSYTNYIAKIKCSLSFSTTLTIELRNGYSKHYDNSSTALSLTYPFSPAIKGTATIPIKPFSTSGNTIIPVVIFGIKFLVEYNYALDSSYFHVYLAPEFKHVLSDSSGAFSLGWIFVWIYTSNSSQSPIYTPSIDTDFYVTNTYAVSQ